MCTTRFILCFYCLVLREPRELLPSQLSAQSSLLGYSWQCSGESVGSGFNLGLQYVKPVTPFPSPITPYCHSKVSGRNAESPRKYFPTENMVTVSPYRSLPWVCITFSGEIAGSGSCAVFPVCGPRPPVLSLCHPHYSLEARAAVSCDSQWPDVHPPVPESRLFCCPPEDVHSCGCWHRISHVSSLREATAWHWASGGLAIEAQAAKNSASVLARARRISPAPSSSSGAGERVELGPGQAGLVASWHG